MRKLFSWFAKSYSAAVATAAGQMPTPDTGPDLASGDWIEIPSREHQGLWALYNNRTGEYLEEDLAGHHFQEQGVFANNFRQIAFPNTPDVLEFGGGGAGGMKGYTVQASSTPTAISNKLTANHGALAAYVNSTIRQ